MWLLGIELRTSAGAVLTSESFQQPQSHDFFILCFHDKLWETPQGLFYNWQFSFRGISKGLILEH